MKTFSFTFYILVALATLTVSKSFTLGRPHTSPTKKSTFKSRDSLSQKQYVGFHAHIAFDDIPSDPSSIRGGELGSYNKENILQNWYKSYMLALDKNPAITKSITAGIINGIGDILSQFIESRLAKISFASNLNWARVFSFILVGWFYVGPFVHYWYEILWKISRWQEKKYASSKTVKTLTSVFVDQTVGVAIFFPIYFYAYEAIEALVGFRVPLWATATQKIQKELFEVLIVQYQVWPITNYINFSMVPENLRVLFGNIVCVFWNAYLCMKVA